MCTTSKADCVGTQIPPADMARNSDVRGGKAGYAAIVRHMSEMRDEIAVRCKSMMRDGETL
jgi:hypothetical protein